MNDFTKYELLSLLWSINYVRERTTNCGDAMRALKTKLQTMIDKYCEHKKDVWPLYTASGDIPAAGYCYECNKPVNKEFIDE
jgi:hypothetical protein